MSLTLYRRCKLGETLIESLGDLKRQNKITDVLAEKIMEKFDKVKINLYRHQLIFLLFNILDYVRRNTKKTKI